eukprot:634425_1
MSSFKVLTILLIIMLLFNVIHTSKYIFVEQDADWDKASSYCQNTYGTSLASIHSLTDNEEVSLLCQSSIFYGCYIGLNDKVNERGYSQDGWVWSDGSTFDWANWRGSPSEPTGGGSIDGDFDCVYIHPSDHPNVDYRATWADVDCSYTAYFICNHPDPQTTTESPSLQSASASFNHPTRTPTTQAPTLPGTILCGDMKVGEYNGQILTFIVYLPTKGDITFDASQSKFTIVAMEATTQLNIILATDVDHDGVISLSNTPAAYYKFVVDGGNEADAIYLIKTSCTSYDPVHIPTTAPIRAPITPPTNAPSEALSDNPSIAPTSLPTNAPLNAPTTTQTPSDNPSNAPTSPPIIAPSDSPTAFTQTPSVAPTQTPSLVVAAAPTIPWSLCTHNMECAFIGQVIFTVDWSASDEFGEYLGDVVWVQTKLEDIIRMELKAYVNTSHTLIVVSSPSSNSIVVDAMIGSDDREVIDALFIDLGESDDVSLLTYRVSQSITDDTQRKYKDSEFKVDGISVETKMIGEHKDGKSESASKRPNYVVYIWIGVGVFSIVCIAIMCGVFVCIDQKKREKFAKIDHEENGPVWKPKHEVYHTGGAYIGHGIPNKKDDDIDVQHHVDPHLIQPPAAFELGVGPKRSWGTIDL